MSEHDGRELPEDLASKPGASGVVEGSSERPSVTPEAVRASEERFRLLADNIAQLAWMADEKGWIFWYNRRWFEYTGTTLQEMEGWGWRKVHHPDHVEHVTQKIRHSFQTGEAWEDLFPLRGRDGEYRWFLSRALPIRNEAGELLCWFGTNTDVTEQREVEQRLLEADRRKNEFIAMLGHELRNPLASIRSAADVIEGLTIEQPQLQQALCVLQRQSTHMARLIDGLLDASRIAHGKIDLKLEPVQLSTLVNQVLRDQTSVAAARNLMLRAEVEPNPTWVLGDATRITQVVENLVGNAIKFSRAPAAVAVRLEREDGWARLSVRDEGQGIRPAMLARIFEPFEQEAQGASRSAGGLGLGLAVAKGLVELHGGNIEAHSEGADKGAQFVVRLPLVAAPDTSDAAQNAAHDDRQLCILIVEDNVDAGTMLSLLLERRGHQVTLAHEGQDGLDLLRERTFDVALCDLGLPDMSGYEFAQAVRSQPALTDLLLIATTGYGQKQDQERSAEAGFNLHLTKPVNMALLEQALAERRTG